jgi:hypothetical protein
LANGFEGKVVRTDFVHFVCRLVRAAKVKSPCGLSIPHRPVAPETPRSRR